MVKETFDLRRHRGETLIRSEEIIRRKQHFLNLGFSEGWVYNLEQVQPTLFEPEKVSDKITLLWELGFSNPFKMIEASPSILDLTEQNICGKITLLWELGFSNPFKMIETLPPILGYAEQNIRGKITLLRELGFSNPFKMIETLPSILGLTEQNIHRRIVLFGRLIGLYNLPFVPADLMERILALFSTKLDKLMVLAKVLREYHVQPPKLTKSLINQIVRANLENTLVALNESNPQTETITDFMKRVRLVRQRGLSKKEKRQIIHDELENFDKIKRRYFRGYS